MKSLVLVLVFLAWFVTPAIADFDAGMTAYKRGDFATAFRELKPLAEDGVPRAQFYLGVMYAKRQGVPQDYTEAVRWYRLAADQGEAFAQADLGVMYAKGQGVPQDYTKAVRWYRLAAAQGIAAAQYNLGVLYAKGQGVPQDYVQAHMWLSLATAQGDKMASDARDLVAAKMSSAQIEEAKRLAREWNPKK